jgi:hypothetical protein
MARIPRCRADFARLLAVLSATSQRREARLRNKAWSVKDTLAQSAAWACELLRARDDPLAGLRPSCIGEMADAVNGRAVAASHPP